MTAGATRADRRETARRLLADALASGDDRDLRSFLMADSNLPGPRGNLELASDFAEMISEQPPDTEPQAWTLCLRWTTIAVDDAPVDDPAEYLPFCGAWALGRLAARTGRRVPESLSHLRVLAADPRWRLREAVANALQALLASHPQETLTALRAWIRPGAWLEMRAVAAGLAEPSLLRDPHLAQCALELHRLILARFQAAADRGPDFRILRQGLGYTVSVAAAGDPVAGPQLLEWLAASDDPDMRRVLRENLKKNRLRRTYPDLVQRLTDAL